MIRRFALLCLALAVPAVAQTTLNGAGATFPYPMYSKWFSDYHKLHPDVEINYQSIGSGGGIRQVLAGTVDFGASDGPMTDEQLSQAKTKILHIPTVLGAVVLAYNVPGVSGEVKFTPEALAGMCRMVRGVGRIRGLFRLARLASASTAHWVGIHGNGRLGPIWRAGLCGADVPHE